MVNTLLNPAYLARHGLIDASINTVTIHFIIYNTIYKCGGTRNHRLARSRNKVIVGEPVVGEFEYNLLNSSSL